MTQEQKDYIDRRMKQESWGFGDVFVSLLTASFFGYMAAFISESFFFTDVHDKTQQEYVLYSGLIIFIISLLYYNPRKTQKTGLINRMDKEFKIEKSNILWKNISDEISLELNVNNINRGLGRKSTDIPGDVYFYSELNNKIIRSKILQFHRGKQSRQTVSNNVMSSGVEFRDHHYSSVQIITEDGMSIDIKSSLESGNELEQEYLALKHA